MNNLLNLQAGQAFVDPFTGEEAFAVEPITNCPHALQLDLERIQKQVRIQGQSLFWSKCTDCANVGENWICLQCDNVYCSRYVKGHMAEHNQNNQSHHIALSFADLSFWCYDCDSYVINLDLNNLRKIFQRAKFSEGEFANGNVVKETSQNQDEELKAKVLKGNGIFIAGDINEQNAYQVLILKQFEKEITIQKGALKGYINQKKKYKAAPYLTRNESEEVIGSVIRFNKNTDKVAREKIVFLVNEIEGFPNQTTIRFEKISIGEEQLELAIYCLDE